ncbi:MAG: hypothetical protein E4H03_04830 [Myxococcales bacterium]|nr:MAG: hypothetical protein E4H03_04830 [Myxococcales bacterium]
MSRFRAALGPFPRSRVFDLARRRRLGQHRGGRSRRIMSLNERQQEAVDHEDGPLLVLAGAGSGKTRVLVHRIARLIEQGRARPHEILAVTFTNKAARELVDRCTARVGAAAAEVWAGTFHGIGARLMRRHAAELGYPAEFSIFDADDQMRLIKQLLEDAGIDPTVVPPEAVRAFIERHKNEARLPDDVAAATDDAFGSRALDLYAAYQKRLRTLGGVDFGDLILGVIVLLRSRPELLERYRQRFRHVLVDEYQDTNHAQYLMISMLAEGHRNICVVGDDDQSIYAWRGANVRNILEFERDFSGAHVVRLDQNYRSTRNIIEAAHAVISNNRERMDKRMWTDSADGPPITIFTATDERDEARYVVEKLIGLGEARSDAAVFYRTNAQSRALEEALVQARIPYTIVGTTRFYERREIKDLVDFEQLMRSGIDVEQAILDAQRKDAGADPATLAWILDQIVIGPEARLPGGVDTARLIAFRGDLVKKLRGLAIRDIPRR